MFDVREAAADNQERIAIFHDFLRRERAEQAESASGVRTVIRHDCLSKQRFDNGRG
jgi:hypothetical protein